MGLEKQRIEEEMVGRSGFGWPMKVLTTTGSTNSDALRWAAEGAPEGAVVVADHQTEGRGRRGRTWVSEPGRALLFSVVLRPPSLDVLPLLSTAVGVGACETIRAVTRLSVLLKWPNDLMIEDRKLAGILVETRLERDRDPIAVAGVGLNVSWDAASLPDELGGSSGSVSSELARSRLGDTPTRERLLGAMLTGIERRYRQLRAGETRDLVSTAESLSSLLGREVLVRLPAGEAVTGMVTGLADDGALEVETGSGGVVLTVGEVETVRRI